MTVPTSYDETSLAAFMVSVLGDLGADLGLNAASMAEPVNDALLAYGETDISLITGATAIAGLRALAKVQAWRAALTACSARYDFSDGTQSLKRSQMFSQCKAALELAQAEATETATGDTSGLGDFALGADIVHWPDDPYNSAIPDAVRVLR